MAGSVWVQRIATVAALIIGASSSALAAEDGVWSVSKSSGEVWISSTGAEQVSLREQAVLQPGETIRTGRTGRVLLVRGEETILVAPNSVLGLPAEKKDGLLTTVLQQAGSILLEVEKRNVKHFEVETPYLAAVVKGTKFRITVGDASTRVEVSRGQVEVSDFKSGQIAQVLPGQVATRFTHGKNGLSLSGSGTFNPVEQGKPRASTIERIPVPKTGLSAPRNAGNEKSIRAIGHINPSIGNWARISPEQGRAVNKSVSSVGVVRISSPIGEVKLNVQKATHGLARGSGAPGSVNGARNNRDSGSTVWSDSKGTTGPGTNASVGSASASDNGGSSAATSTSGSAGAAVAAATAAASTPLGPPAKPDPPGHPNPPGPPGHPNPPGPPGHAPPGAGPPTGSGKGHGPLLGLLKGH